jgi:catalase
MTTATAPSLPREISDTLVAIFGDHPGFREIHAKGIVCEGTFTPSAEARSVSRAEHFAHAVPVTVRFSDFAGVPTITSTDPNASPHGLGVKFHVGSIETDIVGHSVDAFPAATGEEFLAFLKALAASGPDAAKPTAVEVYLSNHPAAMRFVTSMPTPPVSYATTAYHMINAFRFANADGHVVHGRYHVLPAAGVLALDSALVVKQAPDYLADELGERLRKSPAAFTITLQIAQPGDPTSDGTKAWPSDRRVVDLGTLTVQNLVSDSLERQRKLLYDPTHLIDGIELSDDPLPAIRSATYAISYERRTR